MFDFYRENDNKSDQGKRFDTGNSGGRLERMKNYIEYGKNSNFEEPLVKETIKEKKDEKNREKSEGINKYIENTNDPELRVLLIKREDQINEKIVSLEIKSGLDEKEIMEMYLKISETPEIATNIIEEIISANPEKFDEVGNINEFIDTIKELVASHRFTIAIAALIILTATNEKAGVYDDIIKKEIDSIQQENKQEEEMLDDDGLDEVTVVEEKVSVTAKKEISNENNLDNEVIKEETPIVEKEIVGEKEIVEEKKEKEKEIIDDDRTEEEIEEDNLKKIKILFGTKIFARYPAKTIMVSDAGLPEDIEAIFSKLKSSDNPEDKESLDNLLKENAKKFVSGELERLDEYLSNKFRNQ